MQAGALATSLWLLLRCLSWEAGSLNERLLVLGGRFFKAAAGSPTKGRSKNRPKVKNVERQNVERQNAEWDKMSNGKNAEWDKMSNRNHTLKIKNVVMGIF